MRSNLWDDPRISAICEKTGSTEAPVIGALYWLWATADQHSVDGILPGMSCKSIDRKTGVPGIGNALVDVGWIADHTEGVRIVRFEEHNGASAKKRCLTAKRVADHRNCNEGVTHQALRQEDECVTGALAREEKRREEGFTEPPIEEIKVDCPSPSAKGDPKKDKSTGTRLPADWQLPKAWGDWALEDNGALTADDVRLEGEKFRDFWLAKAGKDARKVDWKATWRSWMRSGFVKPSGTAPPAASKTWFLSASAIEAKGAELGIAKGDGESFPVFKVRVYQAAGVTDEMVRKALADQPRPQHATR